MSPIDLYFYFESMWFMLGKNTKLITYNFVLFMKYDHTLFFQGDLVPA
jgi:hypothetical protein